MNYHIRLRTGGIMGFVLAVIMLFAIVLLIPLIAAAIIIAAALVSAASFFASIAWKKKNRLRKGTGGIIEAEYRIR